LSSWNIIPFKEREYILTNDDRTLIRCSPSSKPDIVKLMSSMEEHDVPISYTKFLREIYFTRLPGGDHGDYHDDRVRLAADKKTALVLGKVFVHELAHHLDDHEDIVSDDHLFREKKKCAKHMSDAYAKKNVGEYLAVGFEVFYFGAAVEKAKLRKMNPRLYKTIAALHRKFSRL